MRERFAKVFAKIFVSAKARERDFQGSKSSFISMFRQIPQMYLDPCDNIIHKFL